MIDAAVLEPVARRTERELVLDDGDVRYPLNVIVVATSAGGIRVGGAHLTLEVVQLRRHRNGPQRAAQRRTAEGRALRPTQHLDPLDIHRFYIDIVRGAADSPGAGRRGLAEISGQCGARKEVL